MRRHPWSMFLFTVVALWFFLPSALLRVHAIEVSNGYLRIARTFPLTDWLGLPRPMLTLSKEVTRLDAPLVPVGPCTYSSKYRPITTEPFVIRDLSPWSDACRVQPYRLEVRWTLWLVIPLAPITRTLTVLEPVTDR